MSNFVREQTVAVGETRSGVFGAVLLRALRAPLQWLARNRKRRRTIAELRLLSDHLLRDIGLTREDLY